MARERIFDPRLIVQYVLLIVLVVANISLVLINGGAWRTLLLLANAAITAFAVMWVFMHLRTAQPLVRLFAVVGFAWLGIFISLTLSDYLAR